MPPFTTLGDLLATFNDGTEAEIKEAVIQCAYGLETQFIPPEKQEPMLQFFSYDHLPKELKEISQPFRSLAIQLIETLPRNPERTACLRKLLEAKDAGVRAKLYK